MPLSKRRWEIVIKTLKKRSAREVQKEKRNQSRNQVRVQESVTQGGGIITPYIHGIPWEPLCFFMRVGIYLIIVCFLKECV